MDDVLATVDIRRRRFTVKEYYRMAEVGILTERDRVDVMLLIEVSDTSYRFDRYVKLPLYVRAGVPEVWIVDLAHDVVEVFREPSASVYASTLRIEHGASIAPLAFHDVVLAIDEILTPA